MGFYKDLCLECLRLGVLRLLRGFGVTGGLQVGYLFLCFGVWALFGIFGVGRCLDVVVLGSGGLGCVWVFGFGVCASLLVALFGVCIS